jgi:hypothetical protein
VFKQFTDEGLLVSKASQQGQIDMDGLAWLPPSQHGKPTNNAEPPVVGFAESLKLRRRSEDLNHGLPLF